MKSKGIARRAVFFLSGLSFVNWAYSAPQNINGPGAFFDAEPPSYLLTEINKEDASSVDIKLQINAVARKDASKVKVNEAHSFISSELRSSDTDVTKNKSMNIVSLQEAAQLVVLYHPRVTQVRESEKSEAAMIDVAKSAYYPEVKAGLGMKYDRNTTSEYDKEYVPSANVEINQMVYDFGRTGHSVESAEYGYLGARAITSATNEELIHAVTTDVVSVVRDQALIKLAKEQVNRVVSLGALVEERFEKGASNLSDVLQAQSRIDDVESLELDAQAQYESTVQNLGIMIGKRNITGAVIGSFPAQFSQACSPISNWEQIPEYAIADLTAKQAIAEFNYSKANNLPTISLQGNVSRNLNESSRRNGRNDTRVSLNVSIPIYEGGRIEANENAAMGRARSAEARKEEVRLEVNQALSQLQVRLKNMEKRQSLLLRRVENLRGTKDLYRKQYLDLGTRSLIDLLNSEQEYHQAQVDVEMNKANIVQVQLDCAFYQGKLRQYLDVKENK